MRPANVERKLYSATLFVMFDSCEAQAEFLVIEIVNTMFIGRVTNRPRTRVASGFWICLIRFTAELEGELDDSSDAICRGSKTNRNANQEFRSLR